jgi:hypothetical protein
MRYFKTIVITLLITSGAAFGLTSCEEEHVLPTTISPSGDGGGMEDDGQFD